MDPCFRMMRGFPQVEDLTQDDIDDNDVMGDRPQAGEVSEVGSPSLANSEDLEGWGPHEPETPHSLAADFLFVAGKHWKVLVLLMVHTGMVGMVVCGGDKERDEDWCWRVVCRSSY